MQSLYSVCVVTFIILWCRFSAYLWSLILCSTIIVAARSKACGIAGLNPTESMYVCVRLFCVCDVLYVGSGLATG
jgi:hypothetical protein